LKTFSLAATSVTSALKYFSNEMIYIDLRFTYVLLTNKWGQSGFFWKLGSMAPWPPVSTPRRLA